MRTIEKSGGEMFSSGGGLFGGGGGLFSGGCGLFSCGGSCLMVEWLFSGGGGD